MKHGHRAWKEVDDVVQPLGQVGNFLVQVVHLRRKSFFLKVISVNCSFLNHVYIILDQTLNGEVSFGINLLGIGIIYLAFHDFSIVCPQRVRHTTFFFFGTRITKGR